MTNWRIFYLKLFQKLDSQHDFISILVFFGFENIKQFPKVIKNAFIIFKNFHILKANAFRIESRNSTTIDIVYKDNTEHNSIKLES